MSIAGFSVFIIYLQSFLSKFYNFVILVGSLLPTMAVQATSRPVSRTWGQSTTDPPGWGDRLAYLVCIFSFIGLCLIFFCPLVTFHRLHSSSGDRVPVPHPSVSQCLDRLPIALMLKSKFSLLVLPRQFRFTVIPFLLLLAGDIELNPGPAPLKFAHLNTCSIASINKKHDKPALIQEFISDNEIEIMSVNETFLSENELQSTINTFTPPNYSFIHKPRPGDERGGGVGFIYRSYIKLVQHTIPTFKSFESLGVKFTIGSKSFILLTIYRPPSSSVKEFKEEFSSLLETLISLPSELVISGDFNFHVDSPNETNSKSFLRLLESFGLKNHVAFPTHIRGHTLDLLITRSDSDIVMSVEFDPPFLSDHFALLVSLNVPIKIRPPTIYKTIREIGKINIDQLKKDIQDSDLINSPAETLSELTEQFASTLTDLLDKHAPSKSIRCTDKPKKPWITPEIKTAKKLRSKLETKYRRSKSQLDLLDFKTQARVVSKLISKSRKNYFRNIIAENKDHPKKLWSTMNNLLGRRENQALPVFNSLPDLCKSFLSFFNNKIATLCSKLPIASLNPFSLPNEKPPLLSLFSHATLEEITKIIVTSSNSTCILDSIPTTLLKSCIDELVVPIRDLINLSLDEGIFPESFKHALLKPILKKSNLPPDDMSNYRPISNLTAISKFLERIIYNRLIAHIESFQTYSPFQSAYRRFHSTETALLRIQNDILCAMDSQKVTALVLLDLSAAFDTIPHDILVHRLENWFGISGVALQLLSSYLIGRMQSVCINGHCSPAEPLVTGVPQGSVLGPLLFTMYTTPVAHLLQSTPFRYHLYADDTQIYVSFNSNEALQNLQLLSSTLDDVHIWFSSNKLTLNPSKTEFLIIGTTQQRSKLNCKTLLFGTSNVSISPCARNLGVMINSDLSYSQQISKITQTSYLHMCQIRRIRQSLDLNSAIMLANSLVSSRLDYCNSLFNGLPKSSIKRLQRVQNSLARVVMPSCKKYDHIQPILHQLHWLPITKRIDFKLATLTFKVLENNQPTYLSELLHRHAPVRTLRSAGKNLLVVPNIKSANGRRSFCFAAPVIWNSLPEHIRNSSSLTVFRKQLKTHLFPP